MHDVLVLKRCPICKDPVLYEGPDILRDAIVWCGVPCAAIWDAITPGQWINASEIMQGGRFHNRPDIWTEPLEARERQ